MTKVYPAIIHEEEGYWMEFPDSSGCFTNGSTLEETMEMARETLGLYLVSLTENNQPIPAPSSIADISVDNVSSLGHPVNQFVSGGAILSLIQRKNNTQLAHVKIVQLIHFRVCPIFYYVAKKNTRNRPIYGIWCSRYNAQNGANPNRDDSILRHILRKKRLELSQDKLPLEPESSASAIPPLPLDK